MNPCDDITLTSIIDAITRYQETAASGKTRWVHELESDDVSDHAEHCALVEIARIEGIVDALDDIKAMIIDRMIACAQHVIDTAPQRSTR